MTDQPLQVETRTLPDGSIVGRYIEGGMLTGTTEATRPTISESLRRHGDAITDLDAVIDLAYQALDPILRDTEPDDASTALTAYPDTTSHTHRVVADHTQRLEYLTSRLRALLARVDL